jgi:hypothetical protein
MRNKGALAPQVRLRARRFFYGRTGEEPAMKMPTRRGRCVALTIDFDAIEILDALAPGVRHRGRVLSELLRGEMLRRQERQKLLAEMLEAQHAMVAAD